MVKISQHNQSMQKSDYAVFCEDLSFSYGGIEVLSHVNFLVMKGEICCLCGPSGGGKTTLFNLIVGALKPHTGKISVFGTRSRKTMKLRKRMTYMPQIRYYNRSYPCLVPEVITMPVGLGFTVSGSVIREMRERARELLQMFDRYDLVSRTFNTLSPGEKAIVLLCRALIRKSGVVLLDEPFSDMSHSTVQTVLGVLNKLKEKADMTFIIAGTHIFDVLAVCDRAICLDKKLHVHDQDELMQEDVLTPASEACYLRSVFESHREHLILYHTEA